MQPLPPRIFLVRCKLTSHIHNDPCFSSLLLPCLVPILRLPRLAHADMAHGATCNVATCKALFVNKIDSKFVYKRSVTEKGGKVK
jgi:hypothetical protein